MDVCITASQLCSHLLCPHRTAMDVRVHSQPHTAPGPCAPLPWPVLDLSPLAGEQKEAATRAAVARGEPLIHAGRLSLPGLLGEPDLLRREPAGYVAIHIRAATAPRHPRSHAVRLALYTDILERMGLSAGRYGYTLDAGGIQTRHELDRAPAPGASCPWEWYLRTRRAVREVRSAPQQSRPALCAACEGCRWRTACLGILRGRQDLSLLPGLDRARREVLEEAFASIDHLTAADIEAYIDGERSVFQGIDAQSLRRFQHCARRTAPDQNRPLAPPPPKLPP